MFTPHPAPLEEVEVTPHTESVCPQFTRRWWSIHGSGTQRSVMCVGARVSIPSERCVRAHELVCQ